MKRLTEENRALKSEINKFKAKKQKYKRDKKYLNEAQREVEVEPKTNSSSACAPFSQVNTRDDLLVNEAVVLVDG